MDTKINIYESLENNKIAFVKVNNNLKKYISDEIKIKYGSKRRYAEEILGISVHTLKSELHKNKYMKFQRLLRIAKTLGIAKEILYERIAFFYAKGSNTNREVFLPKKVEINEFFVEGYALYLAEGDNGSNGKAIPRKVRLANSEFSVHKYFMKWLETFFPKNPYYFYLLIPYPKTIASEKINSISKYLNLPVEKIKTHTCIWPRKTDFTYRTCLDSALLIDFLLSINSKVKGLCLLDKKLAAAYIRGMFIGEGTAYFNKSRYVRIEMKNEEEIKYLHKLFKLLGYKCEPTLRTNRAGMWSLYIGAKQLEKFAEEIGFGVHEKRQQILEQANKKILRVNQYC